MVKMSFSGITIRVPQIKDDNNKKSTSSIDYYL